MAQTPIKCFVRLDNLFFTEDWAGTRTPIALATGDGQGDFLAWSLERCHNVAVLPWDYTDPPMPTVAKPEQASLDHAPGCLGGRGEVSKTCPVCVGEREVRERHMFPQHVNKDGSGVYTQPPLVDLDALSRAANDEIQDIAARRAGQESTDAPAAG